MWKNNKDMKLELPKELGCYHFINDKCTIIIKYENKYTGYHVCVEEKVNWTTKEYQTYTTTPSALKALQTRIEKYLEKNNIPNDF